MKHVFVPRGCPRGLQLFLGAAVIFLYAPVLLLIVFSFHDSAVPTFPFQGFTGRWYAQLAQNAKLKESVGQSVQIATISAAVSVILAVGASLALARRRGPLRTGLVIALLSPLVIPGIVFGVALLVLALTLDQQPSSFVTILGHIVISMPFALLIVLPRMMKVPHSLTEAALDLGATRWQIVRLVDIPLLAPALVSAFIVAFTLSFDEYIIAFFTSGADTTLPVYLLGALRFGTRLPEVMAAAAIVMVTSVVLVGGVELWRRRRDARIYGST